MGNEQAVYCGAWSCNGEYIAMCSAKLCINIHQRSHRVDPLRYDDIVRAVAYSPEGQWFASGSDVDAVRLYDVAAAERGDDAVSPPSRCRPRPLPSPSPGTRSSSTSLAATTTSESSTSRRAPSRGSISCTLAG